MGLTYEQAKAKKQEIADKLKTALTDEFNITSFHISHGIINNKNGEYDLRFTITDTFTPNQTVDQDVIDFAKKKVKALVPESNAEVITTTMPKAYKP
jgi:hypothetical protein